METANWKQIIAKIIDPSTGDERAACTTHAGQHELAASQSADRDTDKQ